MYGTTGRLPSPPSQPILNTTSTIDKALTVWEGPNSIGGTTSPEHSGLRKMSPDDIVAAALLKHGGRKKQLSHIFNLSQAFNSRGDLLPQCKDLRPWIKEGKAQSVNHHPHRLRPKEAPRHRGYRQSNLSSKNVELPLHFAGPGSSASIEGASRTLRSIGGGLSQAIEPCDFQRPREWSSKNVEPALYFEDQTTVLQ
jgi:hypothetical protein